MENIQLDESKNIVLKSSDGPLQFTIPALKATKSASKPLGGTQLELNKPSSNINQFILKQLKEGQNQSNQQNVPQLQRTFIIPTLKIGSVTKTTDTANNFIKIQQTSNDSTKVVESQLNPLRQDNNRIAATSAAEESIIDLTTALSSTRIGNTTKSIRNNHRNKTQIETFDIPFIDCDRKESLPPINDYCEIDISYKNYKHNLVSPSTLGKILSSRILISNRTKPFCNKKKGNKKNFQAKHQIKRFLFDTQSPDDIVSGALNRYARVK